MTARAEDQPLPLDEGDAERVAQPPRGQADDGKAGGISQGGHPSSNMGRGDDGAGVNAIRGAASGSEDERDAPGISTDKKADDTK